MPNTPFYDLNDFINACSDERRVTIPHRVLDDAQRLFNLRSKKQVLDAIYTKDVAIKNFVNSRELEKNGFKDDKGSPIQVFVDAYYFEYSNDEEYPNDDGYLAFFLAPIPPNRWNLKSFHEPQKESVTQLGDCFDPKLIENLKKIVNKGN
jgi:hypothetical protein